MKRLLAVLFLLLFASSTISAQVTVDDQWVFVRYLLDRGYQESVARGQTESIALEGKEKGYFGGYGCWIIDGSISNPSHAHFLTEGTPGAGRNCERGNLTNLSSSGASYHVEGRGGGRIPLERLSIEYNTWHDRDFQLPEIDMNDPGTLLVRESGFGEGGSGVASKTLKNDTIENRIWSQNYSELIDCDSQPNCRLLEQSTFGRLIWYSNTAVIWEGTDDSRNDPGAEQGVHLIALSQIKFNKSDSFGKVCPIPLPWSEWVTGNQAAEDELERDAKLYCNDYGMAVEGRGTIRKGKIGLLKDFFGRREPYEGLMVCECNRASDIEMLNRYKSRPGANK